MKEEKVVELELNDIASCVKVIDIVTKRGAFEGSELADVGGLRNRLATFVDAQVENQREAEEPAEEPEKS
jgi:hypothetical protein